MRHVLAHTQEVLIRLMKTANKNYYVNQIMLFVSPIHTHTHTHIYIYLKSQPHKYHKNIHSFTHSFIHSVFCFTTHTLPMRVLCRVRSSMFTFSFQNHHFPLRSFCSRLRLLPHHSVTSNLPFVFPSMKCFIRPFPRKMWPIQSGFFLVILCGIFLSPLILRNNSSFLLTRSNQMIFSILLQHHISKLPRYFSSTFRSL